MKGMEKALVSSVMNSKIRHSSSISNKCLKISAVSSLEQDIGEWRHGQRPGGREKDEEMEERKI